MTQYIRRLPQRLAYNNEHIMRFFAVRTLLLSLLFAFAGQASTVYIQPIQVCDDFGNSCANSAQQLFEAEANKIYAQASLSLVFLPWNFFHETDYLDISATNNFAEFETLVADPNNRANANPLTLNLWFVDTAAGIYGLGYLGGNGIIIANSVFAFNNGNGRIDTIAHEIGHNLGLEHYDDLNGGCVSNNNAYLMTSGGCRNVPLSISQITPDGAALSLLSASEISIIQSSNFAQDAVPEPLSMTITASGLLALLWVRRSR
jgi:hypothetical protein